jgi:hypothetical protein
MSDAKSLQELATLVLKVAVFQSVSNVILDWLSANASRMKPVE